MDKMEELNNMDKTKERISKQHEALVDVINYLDSRDYNGRGRQKIRETVDRVLNGSDWKSLEVDSDIEIHNAEVTKNRYIRQLEKEEEKRIDEGGWR